MTLQQLRYVTAVAETGTISGAAKALFISQPSLTAAIQELEKEMGITIFLRTNRGVVLSREGDEFLGYARQVLMQAELLEERYGAQSSHRQQFAVSAQHYNFAARVFARVVRDRATSNDLTREINAYQPGIGLDDEVSRTVYQSSMLYLKPRKQVSLGYIVRDHMLRSPMAQAYIQAMEDYAEKYKRSHEI